MKYIELTQGYKTVVDDADFEWLSQYKWRFHSKGYAVTGQKKEMTFMHRLIMKPPEGLEVDHINRNRLDNQRVNLRNVTRTVNQLNRKLLRNNTTGHRGISWNKRDKGYYVQLRVLGEQINFGFYKNLTDAIERLSYALEFQSLAIQRKGK